MGSVGVEIMGVARPEVVGGNGLEVMVLVGPELGAHLGLKCWVRLGGARYYWDWITGD